MYKRMYFILFRAISDAMDLIEGHEAQKALNLLERACRDAEEIYIEGEKSAPPSPLG